jgi:hypothetical protein
MLTGIAITSPAIGPAAAMSNKARRLGMYGDIRITAPSVPSKNGDGMKYGSVALTR